MTCDPVGLKAVWYEYDCTFFKCAFPDYSNADCRTMTPGYPDVRYFPGLNYDQGATFYHGVIQYYDFTNYDFTCDTQPQGTQKVLCPCV